MASVSDVPKTSGQLAKRQRQRRPVARLCPQEAVHVIGLSVT